jgi:hypothetical protein
VSFTEDERRDGAEYNFAFVPKPNDELPGVSVFAKDAAGAVHHTYSSYSRGLDVLNCTYQLLDLTRIRVGQGFDIHRLVEGRGHGLMSITNMTMKEVLDAHLAAGDWVVLSDRDIQGGGVEVEFFGERTTLPGGPATLSLRTGAPVLRRSTVHRLFLRELHDYRVWMEPVASLTTNASPEVRLLGESYHESAVRALDRGIRALACWYDPKPLTGVFDRIESGNPTVAAPALEYLGQVLPRAVFKPVSKIFEEDAMEAREGLPVPDRLAEWIGVAWETGDAWLRACAVRASRWAPTFDPRRFATGDGGDPMVRAELEALSGGGRSSTEPRPC